MYRFVPSNSPPVMTYDVSGLKFITNGPPSSGHPHHLQLTTSSSLPSGVSGGCIRVAILTSDASGEFRCEVSAEAPSFQTSKRSSQLLVTCKSISLSLSLCKYLALPVSYTFDTESFNNSIASSLRIKVTVKSCNPSVSQLCVILHGVHFECLFCHLSFHSLSRHMALAIELHFASPYKQLYFLVDFSPFWPNLFFIASQPPNKQLSESTFFLSFCSNKTWSSV